jgi:tetratricopeptide (TPR) repeat protein
MLVKIKTFQKKYDEAENLCISRINSLNNDSLKAFVLNLKAGLNLSRNKVDEAKKDYMEAIRIFPDYLPPYSSLASIYLAQKNVDEAKNQYNTILEKNPNVPTAHMMLGMISESEQDFDNAENHYRKALEINRNFAPAANNLAFLLAERKGDFNEALDFARKAKAIMPEDPAIMDTLGYVYYKKGLYGNAAGEFTDSLNKLENPVVYYHLALVYEKQGKSELAKKQLDQAFKLSETFEGSEEAKQLYEKLNKG